MDPDPPPFVPTGDSGNGGIASSSAGAARKPFLPVVPPPALLLGLKSRLALGAEATRRMNREAADVDADVGEGVLAFEDLGELGAVDWERWWCCDRCGGGRGALLL